MKTQLRNRLANVVCLFNYDPVQSNEESDFRLTLSDLTNSFAGADTLGVNTNYTVFLGSQMAGQHPLRRFLPEHRRDRIHPAACVR
ncbi:MAG: hypothetical protein KGJ60_14125 [Verrucomicrobiota bacterium]|nr:hypothetical protein [Verrucomicrobiota bacterium]